jgi:hypothetical protein
MVDQGESQPLELWLFSVIMISRSRARLGFVFYNRMKKGN